MAAFAAHRRPVFPQPDDISRAAAGHDFESEVAAALCPFARQEPLRRGGPVREIPTEVVRRRLCRFRRSAVILSSWWL